MVIMTFWRVSGKRYVWGSLVIYSMEYTVVLLQILLTGKISGFTLRPPEGETTPVPTILNQSGENVTTVVGGRAILKCKVLNLGTKTVVWRKADKKDPITIGTLTYNPDKRFQVRNIPHLDEWNLIIKDTTKKDSGIYECQISSKDRSIRQQVSLSVHDIKPGISISNTTYVEKGDRIVLECNATADDVDWYKKGHKVITAKGVKITKQVYTLRRMITSTLEIEKASMLDDTDFVCRTSDLQSSGYVKVHVLNDDSQRGKRRHSNYSNATGPSHSGIKGFIHTRLYSLISTLATLSIIHSFICR